jgi:hypothetical protein
MREVAIRAAIALYPRTWRRRYRTELEDCARRVGSDGLFTFVAVLLDLVAAAARERARIAGEHPALAGLAISAILVPLATAAVVRPHQRTAPAASRDAASTPPFLGRHIVRLGTGSRAIVITLNRLTGAATSIQGARSQTELNPNTGQVIAISRPPAS